MAQTPREASSRWTRCRRDSNLPRRAGHDAVGGVGEAIPFSQRLHCLFACLAFAVLSMDRCKLRGDISGEKEVCWLLDAGRAETANPERQRCSLVHLCCVACVTKKNHRHRSGHLKFTSCAIPSSDSDRLGWIHVSRVRCSTGKNQILGIPGVTLLMSREH